MGGAPGAHGHSGLSESHARAEGGRWGLTASRFRGRPMISQNEERAAGRPSGAPLKRDYLTKFEVPCERSGRPAGRYREDENGLRGYQLSRANWQTMKYDSNWNAYADVPRPHAASDLTGFPKQFFG